ncbi:hypothetical protein GW17_00022588 [Ensete ventricosum]|nr:hypothetical protein GW17_00022588 [Ensete ventricosum]
MSYSGIIDLNTLKESRRGGRLLLIEPTNEFEQEEEDLEHKEENTREDLQPVDCMVHSLVGYANPQTMKIGGFLKQKPVTVLIDTKSTNNFMDSKVVARSML